jgi:hypothetical protein
VLRDPGSFPSDAVSLLHLYTVRCMRVYRNASVTDLFICRSPYIFQDPALNRSKFFLSNPQFIITVFALKMATEVVAITLDNLKTFHGSY